MPSPLTSTMSQSRNWLEPVRSLAQVATPQVSLLRSTVGAENGSVSVPRWTPVTLSIASIWLASGSTGVSVDAVVTYAGEDGGGAVGAGWSTCTKITGEALKTTSG